MILVVCGIVLPFGCGFYRSVFCGAQDYSPAYSRRREALLLFPVEKGRLGETVLVKERIGWEKKSEH